MTVRTKVVVGPRQVDRAKQSLQRQATVTRKEVKRAQKDIETIIADPILNYQDISGTFVAATPLKLSHSFGVVPKGWRIVDQNAAANFFRVSWDALSITITASANVNAVVQVYA